MASIFITLPPFSHGEENAAYQPADLCACLSIYYTHRKLSPHPSSTVDEMDFSTRPLISGPKVTATP